MSRQCDCDFAVSHNREGTDTNHAQRDQCRQQRTFRSDLTLTEAPLVALAHCNDLQLPYNRLTVDWKTEALGWNSLVRHTGNPESGRGPNRTHVRFPISLPNNGRAFAILRQVDRS
jgi:hypothetical protein